MAMVQEGLSELLSHELRRQIHKDLIRCMLQIEEAVRMKGLSVPNLPCLNNNRKVVVAGEQPCARRDEGGV